jgi:glycosidase
LALRAIFVAVLFCLILPRSFALSDSGDSARGKHPALAPSEGVYYSLFVRSFADSDDDGIGDLRGLTAKLDYLNDSDDATTTDLGVTGIWLLPIFASPSQHGYDVSDYYRINPDYGTMADFDAFIVAARKRGIAVILDLPCNHSSDRNAWFVASKDPASPYRAWYRWADASDARFDFGRAIWGHKVWNRAGDAYYSGLFNSDMPDFDLSNPSVRAEFKKVAKFWLDHGVSGFRLDAAMHVFNSAKLPRGATSQEPALAWWSEFVSYCRSVRPDVYTVGEVWDTAGVRAAYIAPLGSDFHFDLGTRIIDYVKSGTGGENGFANALFADYETYRAANPNYVDAPFLTNHDQNRVAGLLKGEPSRLKLAAALYILAEGVPFIYYGEEIGMMGAKPDEQIRTPMLWALPGADPAQTAWVESKYNKKTIPVAVQTKDDDSLLSCYRRLVRVKTEHPALYKGRLSPVPAGNASLVSWKLSCAEERALVVHNLSGEVQRFSLPREFASAGAVPPVPVFSTVSGVSVAGDGKVSLPPLCSAVFANNP